MLTLAQWILRLTKGYFKATGKKPDGLAKLKIRLEAAEKVREQDKVIQFPKDRITDWWKPRPGEKTAKTTPIKKSISDEVATGHVQKLKEELPFMSRKELHQLRADVVNRKAYGSFDDVQRRELLDALTNQFTNKPDFASGGIARVGMFVGGLIKLKQLKKMFPRIHVDSLLEASRIKDPQKLQKMLKSFRRTEQSLDEAPSVELFDLDTTGRRPNASGGIAGELHLNRPGYANGNLIYGVTQDEKNIDEILLEKASEKTSELQGIEAAKILAAKKERWKDVLKYDTGNMNDRHFFQMIRQGSPTKIKNLLNTTLTQLNLIYPDENKPETLNDVKRLINKASIEGKLKGDILGNAITLTKVLDLEQESTKIDIKSPILNIKGDIDQNRYDISKDLKIKDFDLALKTTFDEGKQTGSKYKLETPKFKYKDLETQLALEREKDKYNTSNLLKLAADYDMGNLKLGVTGELEKDKYRTTSKVIPKATYDVPTDYGTLSASASKNIIEGGDSNALLSYVYGDTGHPAEADNFFRISAELDPIEGDKKAFIGYKRKSEPKPKYLFSKAKGGLAQVSRPGYAEGIGPKGEGKYNPVGKRDWYLSMPQIDPDLRQLLEELKKRKGLAEILEI